MAVRQTLDRSLVRVGRRLRLQRALVLGLTAAAWSTLLGVAAGAAHVLGFDAWPLPLPWVAALPPLALGVVGAAVGAWRPISPRVAAAVLEHRAGRGYLFSTALEVQAGQGWSPLVEREVVEALESLHPHEAVPIRLPGSTRGLAVGLLVAAGLVAAPEWGGPRPTLAREVAALGERERLSVTTLGSRLARTGQEHDARGLIEAARQLDAFAGQIEAGDLNELEALALLGDVEQELRNERARIQARGEAKHRLAESQPLEDWLQGARAQDTPPFWSDPARRAEAARALERSAVAAEVAEAPALAEALGNAARVLAGAGDADPEQALEAVERELAELPADYADDLTGEEVERAFAELEELRGSLTQEESEEQTGADAPTDTGADAPTDTGDDAPTDTGADAPTDTGDDAPTDTGDDAPTDTGDDAPTGTGDDAPTDTGDDAPTDTGDDAPTGTGDDAPTDTGDDAPTDTGDDAPTDTGDDAGTRAQPELEGGGDPLPQEDQGPPAAESGADADPNTGSPEADPATTPVTEPDTGGEAEPASHPEPEAQPEPSGESGSAGADALQGLAQDMVRDMDPETLRELMETFQGMAPEGGEAPEPPADLAEQLKQLDPEVLRKIMEAAAGLEPPPGAEPPQLTPELQRQLEAMDPATRRKLQEALEGLERPPGHEGRPGGSQGQRPEQMQGESGSGQEGGARSGQEGGAKSGREGGAQPGQEGPVADPVAGETEASQATETALGAEGSGEPGVGDRPGGRQVLLPGRTERAIGELGEGPAQAERLGDRQVEGQAGQAYVPFGEIPDAFREEAEAALSRQRVPESYERVVREYFRHRDP